MADTLSKILMVGGILLLDIALFHFLKKALASGTSGKRHAILTGYWILSAVIVTCMWFIDWIFLNVGPYALRKAIISFLGMNFVVKGIAAIYLILDRLILKVVNSLKNLVKGATVNPVEKGWPVMSRKHFLYKAAVMTASLPLAAKGFGIINRAYDYKVLRERILLPNLPKAFHGLTIGQISDIHTGSLDDRTAVHGGIEMLMREKADLIFFTGDLVNHESSEIREYFDIFSKVSAPLGVYSILGNHDYGDYRSWPSAAAKRKNFQAMLTAHKELGWQLLRNENRVLRRNGDALAILGVENWGIKRFSKYGKLRNAYDGSEDAAVKLLLSHDPSHWEAQVQDYQDIDLTFSGHTHGFQFGVEKGDFRWSPSQYLYKQWAGLYQEGPQYLYVNRGYGFIGFPGRIGINPELTIFELHRA